MTLQELIVHHEGKELKPYRDSVGKLTIGIGRNLTDRGISDEECTILFENDLKLHTEELLRELPWVSRLDEPRKWVLIDMAFNLGVPRLLKFVNTLAAIESGEYREAASHMLSSDWADQVGNRARELAKIMATGEMI